MTIEFEADEGVVEEVVVIDPVAERIREYRLLIESLDKLKTKELKAEGIQMLSKVRRSFRGHSEADLTAIPGGKAERGPFAKD